MNNNITAENMCQTEARTYNKYIHIYIAARQNAT